MGIACKETMEGLFLLVINVFIHMEVVNNFTFTALNLGSKSAPCLYSREHFSKWCYNCYCLSQKSTMLIVNSLLTLLTSSGENSFYTEELLLDQMTVIMLVWGKSMKNSIRENENERKTVMSNASKAGALNHL